MGKRKFRTNCWQLVNCNIGKSWWITDSQYILLSNFFFKGKREETLQAYCSFRKKWIKREECR